MLIKNCWIQIDKIQQREALKFNNKQTVMIRRKNNEISYVRNEGNQSPYRFQRKNSNLSPRLSPIRCRTPTRANVSPMRNAGFNDNYRCQSPIKFVTSKLTSPSTMGFFRQQHPSYHINTQNQKFTPITSDHPIRIQSYLSNDNSSKVRLHTQQNSQRMVIHQNTKLFSKLVSKLNSDKKKQPELGRRNIKPEMYRQPEVSQYQQRSPLVDKNIAIFKIQPIVDNIQPVESVTYEDKQQARSYSQKKVQVTLLNGKENKTLYQEQNYRIKEVTRTTPIKQIDKNTPRNQYQRPSELKSQPSKTCQTKTIKPYDQSIKRNEKSINKERSPTQERQFYDYQTQQYQSNKLKTQRISSFQFDDVKMYLDKVKQSCTFMGPNRDNSIGNISDKNVNGSMMNMDPFI